MGPITVTSDRFTTFPSLWHLMIIGTGIQSDSPLCKRISSTFSLTAAVIAHVGGSKEKHDSYEFRDLSTYAQSHCSVAWGGERKVLAHGVYMC